MSESEYWQQLCFRLNGVGPRSGEGISLPGWCDWFEPKKWFFGGKSSRVVGDVGFVNGHRVTQWQFSLLLPPNTRSEKEIEWAALLPPEGLLDWIRVDGDRGCMEIHPPMTLRASE